MNFIITDIISVRKTDEKKYENRFVEYSPKLISNEIIYRPNGYSTVSFDGAFAINYYLKPDSHIEGDILFYYWNAADYAAADILTADNATGCIIMGDNNDGSYFARVTGIAAKQLDDTYYVAAVYNNADGTYCSGIIAYSLSRYCMNNAKDGQPMQDLAAATAVYGYHAKEYFTK